MLMVVVLIVLLVLPGTATKLIADIVVVALLVLIIIEGVIVGTKVKRAGGGAVPGPEHAGDHAVHDHAGHQPAPDARPQAAGQARRQGLTVPGEAGRAP